ncbi:MAG: heat-inducible transcriptional repressor, partial [Chloroflexota bacterium]|nr:heat-inducible transcriptional repressor [Chloroflexota bacterium]
MPDTLSPRRGRILKHVVEEYVVTAQPVSSDVLVRKYVPSISTATVRNELAALEGFGYLYHPHTSAGRVPSDLGYRYYVEALMGGARLSEAEERLISHQFHQVELDVGEWLRLAASVLSSRVQNPVMVSPPVAQTGRLRRVDLVRIGVSTALVVVITRSGAIRQFVVRLTEDPSSDALQVLTNEWNDKLLDLSAAEVRSYPADEVNRPLLESVAHALQEAQSQHPEDVLIDGLSYIAAQPEFGTSDRLQPVVEALERHGVITSLMEQLLQADDGVYVAIGQEQPMELLRDCSVVLARYGPAGEML